MEIKTVAFVLSSRESGEADLIFSFFTEEFGKILARARGARRLSSKLKYNLFPLTNVRVYLYRGRSGFLVTGASTTHYYSALRRSAAALRDALIITDLVGRLFPIEAPDAKTFSTLERALGRLNAPVTYEGEIAARTIAALWELARTLGVAPETECCALCRVPLADLDGNVSWSTENGGILCGACKTRDARAHSLPQEALALLRSAKELPEAVAPPRIGEEAVRCLARFLRWHGGTPTAFRIRENMV